MYWMCLRDCGCPPQVLRNMAQAVTEPSALASTLGTTTAATPAIAAAAPAPGAPAGLISTAGAPAGNSTGAAAGNGPAGKAPGGVGLGLVGGPGLAIGPGSNMRATSPVRPSAAAAAPRATSPLRPGALLARRSPGAAAAHGLAPSGSAVAAPDAGAAATGGVVGAQQAAGTGRPIPHVHSTPAHLPATALQQSLANREAALGPALGSSPASTGGVATGRRHSATAATTPATAPATAATAGPVTPAAASVVSALHAGLLALHTEVCDHRPGHTSPGRGHTSSHHDHTTPHHGHTHGRTSSPQHGSRHGGRAHRRAVSDVHDSPGEGQMHVGSAPAATGGILNVTPPSSHGDAAPWPETELVDMRHGAHMGGSSTAVAQQEPQQATQHHAQHTPSPTNPHAPGVLLPHPRAAVLGLLHQAQARSPHNVSSPSLATLAEQEHEREGEAAHRADHPHPPT